MTFLTCIIFNSERKKYIIIGRYITPPHFNQKQLAKKTRISVPRPYFYQLLNYKITFASRIKALIRTFHTTFLTLVYIKTGRTKKNTPCRKTV